MAETGTNAPELVHRNRSFGTDLTPSASSWSNRNTTSSAPPKGNISSSKSFSTRINRATKSSSASTTKKSKAVLSSSLLHRKTPTSIPKLLAHNKGTPLSQQLLLHTPIARWTPHLKTFLTQQQRILDSRIKSEPRKSTSKEYYDVTFPSGPLGLQLEPITSTSSSIHDQRDKQQMGCRVAAILTDAQGKCFEKHKKESIKIQEGDVLVAINRQTIVTWPYERIIQHLKALFANDKKRITFRSCHHSAFTSVSTTKKKHRLKETPTILPMFEPRQKGTPMVSPEASNTPQDILVPGDSYSTSKTSNDDDNEAISKKERTRSPSKVKKLSWLHSDQKSERTTSTQKFCTPKNATSQTQCWLLSTPNWDLDERENTDLKAQQLLKELGAAKLALEQTQQTRRNNENEQQKKSAQDTLQNQNHYLQSKIEEQQLALSQRVSMKSELENYLKQETPMEFKTPRSTLKSPLSRNQDIESEEGQADLKTPQSLFPSKSVETDATLTSKQALFSTPMLQIELQKIKDTMQKDAEARVAQLEALLQESKDSMHKNADDRVSQVKAELQATQDCMQKEADDRVAAVEKELQTTKESMQKKYDDRVEDMEKTFKSEKSLMEKEAIAAREAIQKDADIRVDKLENELQASKASMQKEADDRVAVVEKELQTTKESMQKKSNDRVEDMEKAFCAEKTLMEKDFHVTREEIQKDAEIRVAKLEKELQELQATHDFILKEADDHAIQFERELQRTKDSIQKDADDQMARVEEDFEVTKKSMKNDSDNRVDKLERKIKDLEETKEIMQKDADERVAQWEGMLKETKDSMGGEASVLAGKVTELQLMLNSKEAIERKANDHLAQREKELQETKQSMTVQSAEMKELHLQLETTEQQLNDANALIFQLEDEQKERKLFIEQDDAVTEKHIQDLRLSVELKEATNKIMKTRVKQLEKELNETRDSIEKEADAKISKLEEKIQILTESIQSENEESKSIIERQESSHKEAVSCSLRLKNELVAAKDKISNLEQELGENQKYMKKDINDRSAQIEGLRSIVETNVESQKKSGTTILKLEQELKETYKLMKTKEMMLQDTHNQIINLLSDTRDLKSRLEVTSAQLVEKEHITEQQFLQQKEEIDNINAYDTQLAQTELELYETTQRLEAEIFETKEALKEEENKSLIKADEKINADLEIKQLKNSIATLEDVIREKNDALEKASTKTSKMNDEFQAFCDEIDAKDAAILAKEAKISEMKTSLEASQHECQATNLVFISLRAQIADLESRVKFFQNLLTNEKSRSQKITEELVSEGSESTAKDNVITNLREAITNLTSQAEKTQKDIKTLENDKHIADRKVLLLTQLGKTQNELITAVRIETTQFLKELRGVLMVESEVTDAGKEERLIIPSCDIHLEQDRHLDPAPLLVSSHPDFSNDTSPTSESRSPVLFERVLSLCNELHGDGIAIGPSLQEDLVDTQVTTFRNVINQASLLKIEMDRVTHMIGGEQSRIMQLETFLQDTLQEIGTRGEEARKLNSDLLASQKQCQEFGEKLLASENLIKDLEECERRLTENVEREKKNREQLAVEKESQSNSIQTLRRELASHRQITEEQCAINIEELENHIVHLELQIMNVVKTSLTLEDAFTAKERELACAQEIIADMQITAKDLRAREKTLREELGQCSKSKGKMEENFLEMQFHQNEMILELERLRNHTEEVEFQLEEAKKCYKEGSSLQLEEHNKKLINASIENPETENLSLEEQNEMRPLSDAQSNTSAKTDGEVASQEKKYSELQNELRHIKSELEISKQNFQLEQSDWNEVVESLQVECRALHGALEDKKKQIRQLEEELNEDEAAAMADKILWHQQQRELLTAELKKSRQSLAEVEEESESVQEFLKAELTKTRHTMKDQDEAAEFLHKRVFELEDYKRLAEKYDGNDDIDSPNKFGSFDRPLRLRAAAMLMDNVINQQEQTELERALRQW
eukprot:CAMPEP_0194238312 /NCGR_PEP_ID=MMETSP0158-20130606/5078_1 /TAXON_ID=33649 /ORGANISM="Thalassionema nitzschioides, Strain L26-B" /LENGTH=1961 /DNA_ID=CAMNT_0038972531 /DNA_START=95 /DNA_END=5977 /DNA_ORIENTATION=+